MNKQLEKLKTAIEDFQKDMDERDEAGDFCGVENNMHARGVRRFSEYALKAIDDIEDGKEVDTDYTKHLGKGWRR